MKDTLSKLEDMTKKELEQITNQASLSGADLDKMIKAVCFLDQSDSLKMRMDEEELEKMNYYGVPHISGRYSMEDPSRNHMAFNAYGDMSYERGRSPRTGRYVRNSYGHYDNYDRGYSAHSISDRMVDALERMYDEAGTQHEKSVIDKWISKIRNEE